MQTMQMRKKIDPDGHLRLDVPVSYGEVDVNVLLVIETTTHPANKYDCSSLLGKLKWQGDSVKVQREIRDEW